MKSLSLYIIFIALACLKDEFACSNGVCIPLVAVCDNATDCEDGDDEDANICFCNSNEVSFKFYCC